MTDHDIVADTRFSIGLVMFRFYGNRWHYFYARSLSAHLSQVTRHRFESSWVFVFPVSFGDDVRVRKTNGFDENDGNDGDAIAGGDGMMVMVMVLVMM